MLSALDRCLLRDDNVICLWTGACLEMIMLSALDRCLLRDDNVVCTG